VLMLKDVKSFEKWGARRLKFQMRYFWWEASKLIIWERDIYSHIFQHNKLIFFRPYNMVHIE
jgi:hypothetical protein